MKDYESSQKWASCEGLAVCGYVGRFKKSISHIDMIVKSDIPKTKNLL